MAQEKVGYKRSYFHGTAIGEIEWNFGLRGHVKVFGLVTNPPNTPRVPGAARHERLRNCKAAQRANENLNQFAKFQRQWMSGLDMRLSKSKAGMTFWNNAPFSVPAWWARGRWSRRL